MIYVTESDRFTDTLWNKIWVQAGAPNDNTRGTVTYNQGMVMEKIWFYPKIGYSQGWQDNSRGAQ